MAMMGTICLAGEGYPAQIASAVDLLVRQRV